MTRSLKHPQDTSRIHQWSDSAHSHSSAPQIIYASPSNEINTLMYLCLKKNNVVFYFWQKENKSDTMSSLMGSAQVFKPFFCGNIPFLKPYCTQTRVRYENKSNSTLALNPSAVSWKLVTLATCQTQRTHCAASLRCQHTKMQSHSRYSHQPCHDSREWSMAACTKKFKGKYTNALCTLCARAPNTHWQIT